MLKAEDVQLGSVLFLPNEAPPPDSIMQQMLAGELAQKPWGHPAVVTSKFVQGGEQCATIRLCTSFGNQRVEVAKQTEQCQYYVLADNEADTMPHLGSRLATMAPGSGRFQKRTYVNLSPRAVYPIELKFLKPFIGRSMRFDGASTQRIINCQEY